MANQVHGPFGALLVRLSLAELQGNERTQEPAGGEQEAQPLADQAADYLEQLIRYHARAAGGVENLNVPQA